MILVDFFFSFAHRFLKMHHCLIAEPCGASRCRRIHIRPEITICNGWVYVELRSGPHNDLTLLLLKSILRLLFRLHLRWFIIFDLWDTTSLRARQRLLLLSIILLWATIADFLGRNDIIDGLFLITGLLILSEWLGSGSIRVKTCLLDTVL